MLKKFLCLSVLLVLLTAPLRAEELGTSTVQNGGLLLLRFWSNVISPVDGPRCGYYPTCAGYAKAAIQKYGMVKGTIMASERLQRCNGCHDISGYPLTEEGRLNDPPENNVY